MCTNCYAALTTELMERRSNMNFKALKKTMAAVISLSMLSIPSLSFADGDYNPVLANFEFNQNHGGTGATSYTLAELAASTGVNVVPLTEGDNIIIEQAEGGSWHQPKIMLTAVPTERHMVGFNVPLTQTIKTGKLSIDYSMSGMGGLSQRRYPIIMNGNVPVFTDKSGTWALHTSASTNTAEIGYFHDKEFVFERASEDDDWTVSIQYPGWNNWETYTVSKEYLPEITSIGAGSDLIPANNEQSINLRFNRYKITYYPYPELETASNVAVDADIKVKSQMALNPGAFTGATFTLEKLESGTPVGDAIPASATLESDGKTVTVTSNDYFEPGTSYRVAIANLTDTAGNIYTCNRDFTTVAEDIELSAAPVFTYKDSGGSVVSQESATAVTAAVDIANGGSSRNLMASLLVFNSGGVLQKVKVSPFASYSAASIPLEVTLTDATLSGMTVKYKIFEKLADDKIVEVK